MKVDEVGLCHLKVNILELKNWCYIRCKASLPLFLWLKVSNYKQKIISLLPIPSGPVVWNYFSFDNSFGQRFWCEVWNVFYGSQWLCIIDESTDQFSFLKRQQDRCYIMITDLLTLHKDFIKNLSVCYWKSFKQNVLKPLVSLLNFYLSKTSDRLLHSN